MLSSQNSRQIIKIYSVGFLSLLLIGLITTQFFYKGMKHNAELEKQRSALLIEKLHYVDFQKNKGNRRIENNLLSRQELCGNDALLKQKIIFWISKSGAQLVDIHFAAVIAVSVLGNFSQDISLLIELANAHLIFEVSTVDIVVMAKGLELRVGLTQSTVCD